MPPAANQPDLRQWWVNIKGKPTGPHEVEAVKEMLRRGEIAPGTLLCPVAGPEWKPLQSWPPFAGVSPPPARSPAPTPKPGRLRRSVAGSPWAAAFRRIALGMLLGLLTGGGLLAWWWFGGTRDLPREGVYLPDNAAYVLTVRLNENLSHPLASAVVRRCLTQTTKQPFSAEWEKEFERSFGVPPGYVEMLLLCGCEDGNDWLLVVRTDRPLNAKDVQQSRSLRPTGKELRFESYPVGKYIVFLETGGTKASCFCLPTSSVILFAPRKEILTEALTRNRWPRFSPALKTTLPQADFSRDLTLAVSLAAAQSKPWHEALLEPLDTAKPPPENFQEALGAVLEMQRERNHVKGLLLCPTSASGDELRRKWQSWLERQTQERSEGKFAPFQSFTVSGKDQVVLLQGEVRPGAGKRRESDKEAAAPAKGER